MERISAKYGTARYGKSQYGLIYGDNVLTAKIALGVTPTDEGPQIFRVLDATIDSGPVRMDDTREFE